MWRRRRPSRGSSSSDCSRRPELAEPRGVRYGVAVITLERDHERALGVRPSVSAVIFDRRRRLLLQQRSDGGQWGLPGGSVEIGESLAAAVTREVLEETAHRVTPTALLGVYRWLYDKEDVTFLRFAFLGRVEGVEPGRALDKGILAAVWLTPAELAARRAEHRSPLVQQCVDDFLAGRSFPLDVLSNAYG